MGFNPSQDHPFRIRTLHKRYIQDEVKSPQFGLRLTVPEGLLALIQQKTALLFWDIPDSKPVWLSEAISQREIAANSTYWKAKVRKDGLVDGEGVPGGKKGVFWINRNPGPGPKTVQGHTPESPQFGLRLAIPEGLLTLNR